MTPAALLSLLRNAVRILSIVAVACTFHLYLYPLFRGCAFPLPPAVPTAPNASRPAADPSAFRETLQQHISGSTGASAPFRLLALGDPQLEGDTSIRNYGRPAFLHLEWAIKHLTFQTEQPSLRKRLRQVTHDLVDVFFDDIPDTLESIRKRIDLFGNDFYLGHIYRTLRWWAKPTHVTVLGDLLGSQWIRDSEFHRRSARFWNRSFKGAERIPDDVAQYPADDYNVSGVLGTDDEESAMWQRRLINVVGNHDVGYAGDLTPELLERFELAFGKAAYELRFELPINDPVSNATIFDAEKNPESNRLLPELRILNINNMNLDTPALDTSLQDNTYSFINALIHTSSAVEYKGHFTIILTHMPLYKPEGVCVDSPFFDFHESGGVKEQNQLSADASRGFLEGIYGLNGDANAPAGGAGRPGVILNGHDHEGCDTYHFINQSLARDERRWQVARWDTARKDQLPGKSGIPGMREITVRSMMADFDGNAGLLSVWFDQDSWEWKYEFATCALGRQYYWWFVHVFDIVLFIILVVYGTLELSIIAGFDAEKWLAARFFAPPPPKAETKPKKIEGETNGSVIKKTT
ncbi:putative polarized growth protein [Rosellinia necatrix]|uniref:Putative polarized growth protein n=1 Tax=Rosellinia necatrix TaxID=77044 RepID=A0A1W2TC14_ROSNE|nr:putative polarized growth protein [Rosellinia necatrix]